VPAEAAQEAYVRDRDRAMTVQLGEHDRALLRRILWCLEQMTDQQALDPGPESEDEAARYGAT
jgi:hypothetical protein